ncbi:SDR family NAD(P)-dependent oxidoreductase, partial [Candidatus Woesearchaeota archaeon]|nr:SDR family NAD(P)-dependent oxidoreductase [Candidatus Woesearchaeota archaeon]
MKILVTGGAGFIGSHIADYFVEKGDEVIIFDNLNTGRKENINSKAVFIEGDITNIEELEKAMIGVDYVFHHAALVSVPLSFEKPELNEKINVEGTKKVLETALKKGVKKVVLASSAAVYGDNENLPLSEDETLKP